MDSLYRLLLPAFKFVVSGIILFFFLNYNSFVSASEATVKSEFLEVFTAAGRGYPIFFVVENGESFKLLKRKTDWIKIKSQQGQVGWVSYKDYASSVYLSKPNIKKQAIKSKWEFGMAVGKFGSDDSFSAGLGYYIKPTVSVQAEYKKTIGEFSHTNMLTTSMMLQVKRKWVVSPFVLFGTGIMENIPRQSLVNGSVEKKNMFFGGAGINYIPYKRLNLRFTINNFYINKTERSYIDYRLGVYALFG